MNYQYLPHIDSPADLKKVPRAALPIVAEELRDYLVSVVSKVGGHLASSLGAVELTLAVHDLNVRLAEAFYLGCGASGLWPQDSDWPS